MIIANVTGADYRTWPGYIGWGEAGAGAGLAVVVYQSLQDKALESFDAVIASLQKSAAALHIDANRIVVWSGSANVQLGLPVAMDASREYIRGAVVYYGAADIASIRTDLPLLYVRAGLDSTGMNERINALVSRALAANAPWIVENNAAGYHGFEIMNDDEVSRSIIARTLDYVRSVVRPEVSSTYAALALDATLGGAFARGDWPAAVAGYRQKIAKSPDDGEAHRRLAIALMETKQYADSLAQYEEAWRLGRRGPRDTAYPAARAAAAAGNVSKAIEWLRIVYDTRFAPPLAELDKDAAFDAVRGDAKFVEFRKSLVK
jgi:tetratricopeptide (TPR) repeat protein